MRKAFLYIVLLLSTNLLNGQTPRTSLVWPEISKETKPWTRWWWMGSAVDSANLTAAMESYKKVGLGGLELTPIYGVHGYESKFIDFLSPKWMDMFEFTLHEGKRLNLGIDLANATGWPFGGPWVTKDDACKYVTYKTYTLKEGEQFKDTLKYVQKPILRVTGRNVDFSELTEPIAKTPGLQEKALDQVRFVRPIPLVDVTAYSSEGETLDLTSKVDNNGILNWTAPAGSWTIYALFRGWHGKLVERAAPGGEGDVIDHFSEQALDHYLEHFEDAFKGRDVSYLRGYFNDSYEVDDAQGQADWTPAFFDEFYKRRGYDLHNFLPALFGKDTEEKNSRVICDFRETISDLLYEHFTNVWHNWAVGQGKIVRNQAHGSPANILDLYATVDIPETEGNNILRLKFATSAAHVMGKQLSSSESATWLNDHFLSSLGDVKLAMDRYFLGGVNHTFYHGTDYSPQNEPWPGWLFYAAVHFQPVNPFWNDFPKLNDYVTRCQSFLQKGEPDNDVLAYFPIYDSWSNRGRYMLQHFDGLEKGNFTGALVATDADWMLEKGYAFDFISDRQISMLQNGGSKIKAPGGNYQTILFSGIKYLPVTDLEKAVELAKGGATVIFHKNLPEDVPGLGDLETRQNKLRQLISGMNFTEVTGTAVKMAKVGNGMVLTGDSLKELLDFAKVRNEPMYEQGLQCIRRKFDNSTVYFIVNNSGKDFDNEVSLNTEFISAGIFNPYTDSKGKAITHGSSKVLLQLKAGESCIVETFDKEIDDPAYPYYKTGEKSIPVVGKWSVVFLEGGPVLPSNTQLEKLTSWTEFAGDDGKKFSGTAKYSIWFKKPAGNNKFWMLDLGKVCRSASVYLNGEYLGTLIGPDFRLVIPSEKLTKNNLLEIKVSNLMANRIIDMDKQGIHWKKFYNTNFQGHFKENIGIDGVFTAAKWNPLESGLIGPVVLRPLEIVE